MTAGINFIFQQDKPNSVDSKQGPSCREATVLFLLKVYPEFLNLSVGHFTIFQSISECGTKIGKTFRVQLATFTGLTLDCSTPNYSGCIIVSSCLEAHITVQNNGSNYFLLDCVMRANYPYTFKPIAAYWF